MIEVKVGTRTSQNLKVVVDKLLCFSPTAIHSGSDTNIGAALASLFGATGGAATVYEQGVYNNLNNNAATFLASAINTGTSTVPKAYLNYVFFDQDFNLVMSKSGYQQVDAGASGAFDLITANGLIMEQAGYLYVYVSNEGRTTDGGNVYFDALRVNHKKGAIIQEDHYYPFGLTINALSSSAPLSKPNNYKFNGNEIQTDFDLGLMDFNARFYDPQLGRFMQVDPLSDDKAQINLSPYQFSWNNPILYNDPTGLCPDCPDGQVGDTHITDDDTLYLYEKGGWVRQDGSLGEVVVTAEREELELREEEATMVLPLPLVGPSLPHPVLVAPWAIQEGWDYGKRLGDKDVWDPMIEQIAQFLERMGVPSEVLRGPNSMVNSKQDKALTPGEIGRLKDAGHDPHELKGGKRTGQSDLYKQPNGDIVVKGKGGKGPGEPTGLNMNDF